jgi:hypothetical protein
LVVLAAAGCGGDDETTTTTTTAQPLTRAGFLRQADQIVVPGLEAEVRAIRALGAPAGDEATVERILRATERGIAEIEADPERAIDGPPPGLRQAGRLAGKYGSRECRAR